MTVRHRKLFPLLLLTLHAVIFALALPPFDVWWLVFIAPAPLALAALMASSTARVCIAAFITQFAMWLWLLRWIIPVTAVGYPALAGYMSIWGVVFVWIIRRANEHRLLSSWPMMIVVPIVWTGVEYFRGDVLFYGYPWYLLAHPMIESLPFVQSADLFGTYFISFLCAMFSGFIVDIAAFAQARSLKLRLPYRSIIISALALSLILGANIVYGLWRMKQTGSLTSGPRILSIQTNLPLDIKIRWTKDDQTRDLLAFTELTREALASVASPPDVIVWPETMVPGVGFEPQTLAKVKEMYQEHGWDLRHLHDWPMHMIELQRELQIPLLVGSEAWVNTHDRWEGERVRLDPQLNYNSAYLLQGEPPFQRYDKYFLTPFGETMPYISAWPWLERQLLEIGVGADLAFELDSNPDVRLLQLKYEDDDGMERTASLATPICFEDTVARYCRSMMYRDGTKVADAFVNISNDGWFHQSNADRRLHAMIARFRTIENRVPMVRSVNTGMSLWIDSCGRILGAIEGDDYGKPLEAGWVMADVQLDARHPLYARVGEIWPFCCMIATLVGCLMTFLRRKSSIQPS